MKTLLLFLALSVAFSSVACADPLNTKHYSGSQLKPRRPLIGETTAPAMTTWGTETVWYFGNGSHQVAMGIIPEQQPGCWIENIRWSYTNYGEYTPMFSVTWVTHSDPNEVATLIGEDHPTGMPYSSEVRNYQVTYQVKVGDQVVAYVHGQGAGHLLHWMEYDYVCPN